MNNDIIITAQEIKKHFTDGSSHRVDVLKGIFLDIKKGETTAIMGPSGAGKSVLLNILGGLEPPSAGICKFQEQDIYTLSKDHLAEWRNKKIGFIFQFHQLLFDFSALENVMMPALISGLSYKKAKEKAQYHMAKLRLDQRFDHRVLRLSGGEQQRVAIARALINEPEVILADEPTGSLDHETGMDVINQLLNRVSEEKLALIVVTHNQQIALQCSNRWQLQDGKLVNLNLSNLA